MCIVFSKLMTFFQYCVMGNKTAAAVIYVQYEQALGTRIYTQACASASQSLNVNGP